MRARINFAFRFDAALFQQLIVLKEIPEEGILIADAAEKDVKLLSECFSLPEHLQMLVPARRVMLGIQLAAADPIVQKSAENSDLREHLRMSARKHRALHRTHGQTGNAAS